MRWPTGRQAGRAALRLLRIDDEPAGEGLALRTWGGDGVVHLPAEDAETRTLLLERLDEERRRRPCRT